MADENQLAAVRQQKIVDLINRQKSAKLGEICESFGVSVATARRDLATLDKKGQISRTHGGAVTNLPVSLSGTNESRAVTNVLEKSDIGLSAISLIKGDQTVFLDAGTSTMELVKHIPVDSKCRFVTTCLGIAIQLQTSGIQNFYVIGGAYHDVNDSFTGSMAITAVRSLSFDISFLSVTAIDIARQQISIGSEQYSQIQKEIIAVSRQNYVLADHTKFRPSAFVGTASFDKINGVVTSSKVPSEQIERMRMANLDMIIATHEV